MHRTTQSIRCRLPQGLKPLYSGRFYGTAKAVPRNASPAMRQKVYRQGSLGLVRLCPATLLGTG